MAILSSAKRDLGKPRRRTLWLQLYRIEMEWKKSKVEGGIKYRQNEKRNLREISP
jgi:hypothetical protein